MELDREAAAALGIPGDVVARAAARRREGRTLGEALAELGATDAATFARALAEAAGLPFAPAPAALPARELTAVPPMPFAKRHLVLPLARDGAGLAVAIARRARAARAGAGCLASEPGGGGRAVRSRTAGLLHDVLAPPARLAATIASRVKIMAGLAIAGRLLPQDGRIRVRVAGRDIDVRVSIVPTAFGERVALRLLDRASALPDLTDLGLTPATARTLERLLGQSHGIILVTGPTGSGKTTTLYAALRRLATGERNIMTIEDPIEYQLRSSGQLQASSRRGLTLAAGLHAVVRQDPDVILVGEIRDRETAEIAMQAALTGHLVFSTLHTNDAPGAMTRLVDMGVEPFLIASSVLAVLAQRLLRRVCDGCAVAGRPADDAGRALGDAAPEVLRHAGPGCTACRGTGYRGRTAIHELLVVDDPVRTLVMARADAAQVRRHATAAGMATLRDDGCAKARAGLTTVAEVLRVTQDEG